MTDEHDDVQSTEPLSALFMEPPLNDDGFTAAVMGPLDRNRRTRRIALGTGWIGAALVVLIAGPTVVTSWTAVSVPLFAAAMTLTAVCGVVWIGTSR